MTPPELPGIFGALAPVLDRFGYIAVGAFLFLEDFGVPLPGETILIAAALYAGAGHLNVLVVGLIGFAAAVLGDNVGYVLGRTGGRALALKFGRYVLLNEKRLSAAESWFSRHGGKVVIIARFVEGLRQANGWIAGITGMPWLKFVACNAVGAAIWIATWTTVGYVSGNNIMLVYDTITRYLLIVVIAAVVIVAALIARRLIRRRRHAGDTPGSTEGETPGEPADDTAGN